MAFPSSTIESGLARPSSGVASPPQKVRSRTQSISSDRPSTIAHSLMSPPLSVSPEAAFIAASAASQIVTNDHDSHADAWYDQHGVEPSGETALVSNAALQLVNNFLDQLLFNFLSVSRSTTLTALRPAVSEVLKPKLAKDAINQADEELREYLGGGDDDDLLQPQQPAQSPRDWDLELVWKRTRLRCMVYSSLGDMEEEDEDYYMEQENLDGIDEDRLGETVSPAVAIFLTSILEFMGEQALVVAGQAAYHRMRVKFGKELKEGARSPTEIADRIIVEELDMERVALDRTLGRLWRAWKKRIRSPVVDTHPFQRPASRDSNRPALGAHLRQGSAGAESAVPQTVSETPVDTEVNDIVAETAEEVPEEVPEEEETTIIQEPEEEYLRAAAIPLPVRERELAEILIPGLAYYSDDEEEQVEKDEHGEEEGTLRPKSLMIFPQAAVADLPTPTMSQPHTPVQPRPRKRSNSLPTPSTSPYTSPAKRAAVGPVSDEQAGEADVSEETPAETVPAGEAIGTLPEEPQAAVERSSVKAKRRSMMVPAGAIGFGAGAAGHRAAEVATAAALTSVAEDTTADADASDEEEEESDEIDEFTEEPEILTSSRVSISGRSNSPTASVTTSEHSRPLSINPNLPVRSSSVHSLRVIEVTPRSPVTRSRGSSVDAQDHIPLARPGNLSRTSSISTPPIVEEGRTRSDLVSPALRSPLSGRPTRAYTSESISEAEEVAELQSTGTPTTAESMSPPVSEPPQSARRFEDMQSQFQSSQAIFGSVARHNSPPRSPAKPTTKVTILNSTASSGTFFMDDNKPEPPSKSPAQPPAKAASPTLPERSTSRPVNGNLSVADAAQQASSIGAISVDRSSPHRESPELAPGEGSSPGRSRDAQATIRQNHASASSTSSSSTKFKPMRSSEESTAMRPEDVARNFEELIQSDQTIQYTLTPESMRDIDHQSSRSIKDGSSAIMQTKSRKSEDAAARQTGDRSRSSSVNRPNDLIRTASISRSTGLSSHPVDTPIINGRLGGPVPRSPTSMSTRSRGPAPQAREARVPRESLSEFAEFIRETGPSGETTVSPILRNGAGPGSVRNLSRPPTVSGQSITSRVSTSYRQRYQARDATVDYKGDNSDLIDFIRRGPPSAGGNPRIPRTVAPFRTTMDSDQLSGAVGGKAVDATIPDLRYSGASTNVTESSMNSSSALLKKERPQERPPVSPPQGGNMFDDADMMPKRKTRRVRDPYAIDFSDEEEDEEEMMAAEARRKPKQAPAREESLMDFLNSVPPPPESNPVPFNIPQTQNVRQPKKKASAPSLMSRFTRSNSSASQSIAGSNGPISPRGFESRSLSSRAGGARGYIPIQVNMPGFDKYGSPVPPLPSSSMGQQRPATSRPPGSSGRVMMRKFEPREAQSIPSRSGTSELADFLMNSEPPRDMGAPFGLPSPPEEETGSLSRVFGRRKKSAAI